MSNPTDGVLHAGALPRGLYEVSALNVLTSDGLGAWLAEWKIAIALTTGNRLMLVGRDGAGAVRVSEHRFDAVAGIAADAGRTLRLVSNWQLWRLDDALADRPESDDGGGHDRLFLPQSARTTGFLGSYDLAIGGDGQPMFTSAVCNCVGTLSERLSFTAVWRPPFVSALGGGDRCHLTGLTLEDGALAYVTSATTADVPDGWRSAPHDAGVVVDARTDEIVAAGLALPHSPRLWRDRLLVTAGGTGELLAIDPADGSRELVARIPGLARGLAVVGDHALLGCSQLPGDSFYAGAPIGEQDGLRHGLVVVDLARGTIIEELQLLGASGEVIALDVLTDTAWPGLGVAPGGLTEQLSIV